MIYVFISLGIVERLTHDLGMETSSVNVMLKMFIKFDNTTHSAILQLIYHHPRPYEETSPESE